jgi:hypothetical protein
VRHIAGPTIDEPKPLSFAAAATARLARFISFREALTKLAERTGDSYSEIAAELKAAGFDARDTIYPSGDKLALSNSSRDFHSIAELLDLTIRTGAFEPDWSKSKAHNPGRSGWLRERFIEALRERRLPCPDSLSEPPPYKPRTTKQAPPLPRSTVPTGDDELLQGLEDAEAECEDLRQQLQEAQREIERLKEESPPVEGRVRPTIVQVHRQFWSKGDAGKHRPTASEILDWIRAHDTKLSEAEVACVERAACPVDRDRATPNETTDGKNAKPTS